ncbi:hypothetical protein ACH5AL_36645 [Actinacidiphila glaucinigra]|uniref:hypothetical protein n=1 Tax=Actinacidiphila glaucinigra TaxID=235986 RepID=UPI0037BBDC9C
MSQPEQDPQTETPPVAWSAALRGAVRGRAMAQTTTAALIVGSTLFMVNLYSQVRDGPFTWVLAARTALTFLVPWLNATMGITIGLRRAGTPTPRPAPPLASATPPEPASSSPQAGCLQPGLLER